MYKQKRLQQVVPSYVDRGHLYFPIPAHIYTQIPGRKNAVVSTDHLFSWMTCLYKNACIMCSGISTNITHVLLKDHFWEVRKFPFLWRVSMLLCLRFVWWLQILNHFSSVIKTDPESECASIQPPKCFISFLSIVAVTSGACNSILKQVFLIEMHFRIHTSSLHTWRNL